MSKRKASPVLASCFLPLVGLALLLLVILAVTVMSVPGQALDKFGPPSPGLSSTQRYLLSARLLLKANDLLQPADPAGTNQAFKVEIGEPTPTLIGRLYQQGLIRDPDAFRYYLTYTGLDTSLQAGQYSLSPAMTAVQIAQAMQDATPAQVTFPILAGWRLEEIAAALPTSGLKIAPDEFLAAVYQHPARYAFLNDLPASASIEGFLFPDSYELPRSLNASGLVEAALSRFDEQLTPELKDGFTAQGLSVYQAVILASIVQREAVLEEEMPTIASVFYNRLAAGARLAADPTVQYSLGKVSGSGSWWKNPLSVEDLKFDSPYNTYVYAGLPPGPISNPGLAALRAVAFPAQTHYYYFRALCDGSGKHAFAQTYEEHLQNACP